MSTCKDCIHCFPTTKKVADYVSVKEVEYNECRRYPPTLIAFSDPSEDGRDYSLSKFPEVDDDEYCGEFRYRPVYPKDKEQNENNKSNSESGGTSEDGGV